MDYDLNHDGGVPPAIAQTGITETDAAEMLVRLLAESDITSIDWCIGYTAEHNCRRWHDLPMVSVLSETRTTVR